MRDPVLKGLYRDRGFRFASRFGDTLMALPLGRTSLRAAFGPNFFHTPVDRF
ncbi:MAG: hypothetical protein R6X13_02350 [bacterium]